MFLAVGVAKVVVEKMGKMVAVEGTATMQLGAAMQRQVLLHDNSALTNLYQNGESDASGGR
jgi:hypothetical protein